MFLTALSSGLFANIIFLAVTPSAYLSLANLSTTTPDPSKLVNSSTKALVSEGTSVASKEAL